jgi:hypothetical protein
MKVIKSVKMKPPEVAPLEMLSTCVVHRRMWWVELSSCRSSRSRSGVIPNLCASVLVTLLHA